MDKLICKICGKECSSKSGFSTHMTHLHEMTILDYQIKYEGLRFPTCPICGKDCKLNDKGQAERTCGDKSCKKALKVMKIKETNLKKYGCENPSQSKEIKAKREQTCLRKYGCSNPLGNRKIIEKVNKTNKERYGVARPMQSEEFKRKAEETTLRNHGVRHPLQSKEIQERMKETNREKYGTNWSLQSDDVKNKTKLTNLEKYGAENVFASDFIKERMKQRNLELYGVENAAQRPEVQEKTKRTNKERYGADNIFKTEKFKEEQRQQNIEKYGVEYYTQTEEMKEKSKATNITKRGCEWPSQNHEIHRKMMAHRAARNLGYDSKSEKKLAEMLSNRKVSFESHFHINGHEFDFAVYNKNGDLKCLVEIDGEYNHGLISDIDGKHVQGEKDCERFMKVPEGVNLVIIDSSKVTEENITEIMKSINVDYEKFIRNILNSLPKEFPYPKYEEKRMKKDWEHLCSYKWNRGQRLGMSIVSNFHESIWSSRVGKNPSPVEAWNNPELLEKCVRNRFIYRSSMSSQIIAQGFNVCKLAPKVSVFNPSLARYILDKYAQGAKTVIDPFSGFSGRMLGACSLGLKYTGYDLNETAVKESKEIIKFLGLDATVEIKDIFDNSGSADVLFTCPPYGAKETWDKETLFQSCEHWIYACLKRFSCSKYIFVVDDPGKYKDNVVEEIKNTSHFSDSKEHIVIISK